MGDAGGEAGLGGGVGCGEAEVVGNLADFLLGELGIAEGGDDLELLGGLATGARLEHVISVLAVSDGCEVAAVGEGVELCKELGFAEVAAVDGVGVVAGVVEFLRGDDLDLGAYLAGECDGVRQGLAWEAGAIGYDGQCLRAEDGVGYGEEAGAIDAAGVGDEERGVGGED
jgi:hypothetical protein